MIWQTRSNDSADTVSIGEQLGRALKPPMVIELSADLGGGKTTFVSGLARGLGIEQTVTSPSFTLSREYRAKSGTKLYHFDFYRLNDSGVLADQLAEAISDPKAIVCVEWSDIVKGILPSQRLTIKFAQVASNADARDIQFEYPESLRPTIEAIENSKEELKP